MTPADHLNEQERQGLADGSLDDGHARDAAAHLAGCAECAADVARLRALMDRIRCAPRPSTDLDTLWPEIRSRIEARKIVSLPPSPTKPARRDHPAAWIATAAAAGIVTFGVVLALYRAHAVAPSVAVTSSTLFATVLDSSQLYRDEATQLLDELELRRAILRPTTRASLDDDLRTIDQAIGELEDAIARDPNNPALRQLLASSYRQKIELLKRANNAG